MCFTYRSPFVSSVREPRSAEPARKREPNIPAALERKDVITPHPTPPLPHPPDSEEDLIAWHHVGVQVQGKIS